MSLPYPTKGRPPMANVIQHGQYEWKDYALRRRYEDTQRFGQQGECTSFGYLAAYIVAGAK